MNRNRTRHNLCILCLFVLVLIVVCLACLIAKDRPFSDTENRSLAQKPALSASALADGSFFSGLDSWYSDQFPARDGWISMHLWQIRRLGQKESGGVYLGRARLLAARRRRTRPPLQAPLPPSTLSPHSTRSST